MIRCSESAFALDVLPLTTQPEGLPDAVDGQGGLAESGVAGLPDYLSALACQSGLYVVETETARLNTIRNTDDPAGKHGSSVG